MSNNHKYYGWSGNVSYRTNVIKATKECVCNICNTTIREDDPMIKSNLWVKFMPTYQKSIKSCIKCASDPVGFIFTITTLMREFMEKDNIPDKKPKKVNKNGNN
jgi:hypothetical protein